MKRQTPSIPPHDRARRLLFAHRSVVEDLLRLHVREPWVDELDLSTLRREPEISIAEALDARESDLVWSVRWRDRRLYVLILIEFQSQPDRWLALRQLIYVALFYQKLAQSDRLGRSEALPPVFPVVIYNGSRPWRAPTRLRELIGDAPDGLERYQPRIEYFLLDELRLAPDLSGGRDLVGAIAALEQSRKRDDLVAVVDRLIAWLDGTGSKSERRAFASWLKRVLLPRRGIDAAGEVDELMELRSMLAQRVQEWRRADLEKDRLVERTKRESERTKREAERTKREAERTKREAERAERTAARAQQAAIEMLRQLVQIRFGHLSAEAERRLSDATTDQIVAWSERVRDASTFEELFRGGSDTL